MSTRRRIAFVTCAAPLAERAPEFVRCLSDAGWSVTATASLNANEWIDRPALDAETAVLPQRQTGQPRPAPAAAVIVLPATFNTLNKLRAGISDTPALGVLNDAVGQRLPLLVVPMISERLADHPAWIETSSWLHDLGATLLDPSTGADDALKPLPSGSGTSVAESFDSAWLLRWLGQLD